MAKFRALFVLPFEVALRYERPLYYALLLAGILVWLVGGPFGVTAVLIIAAMVVSSLGLGAALERAGRGPRR